MKNLILSLCILVSGIALSQDISFTTNESKIITFSNGEYFQNNMLYSGKFIAYFENGKIKDIKGIVFTKGKYKIELDIYSGLDDEISKSIEKKEEKLLRNL